MNFELPQAQPITRITFELPVSEQAKIKAIAAKRGVTVTDILRAFVASLSNP